MRDIYKKSPCISTKKVILWFICGRELKMRQTMSQWNIQSILQPFTNPDNLQNWFHHIFQNFRPKSCFQVDASIKSLISLPVLIISASIFRIVCTNWKNCWVIMNRTALLAFLILVVFCLVMGVVLAEEKATDVRTYRVCQRLWPATYIVPIYYSSF